MSSRSCSARSRLLEPFSSAYKAFIGLVEEQFPTAEWNVYCFQFSDGDNWGEDNQQSLAMLREKILPHVNLFCYGQVESPYGSGEYLRTIYIAIYVLAIWKALTKL